jgi:hypothetical protein
VTDKEKVMLSSLKKIQKLCNDFYKKGTTAGESIQDIWRTANFAVIDAEKKK